LTYLIPNLIVLVVRLVQDCVRTQDLHYNCSVYNIVHCVADHEY